MEDYYVGSRTNITFLTGEPCNGKTEWLYNMLNKRKNDYIKSFENKIKRRFLAEQNDK